MRDELSHLWGKSSLEKNEDWKGGPIVFHPVVCHLLDSGLVTGVLWDMLLTHTSRRILEKAIGLEGDDCKSFVSLSTGLHDIGKISPPFEAKRKEQMDILKELGYEFPLILNDEAYHGIVSTWALYGMMNEGFLGFPISKDDAWALSSVIGGHHGRFVYRPDISNTIGEEMRFTGNRRQLHSVGNQKWHDGRCEVASVIRDVFGGFPNPIGMKMTGEAMVILGGLIPLSDWISSDSDLFPPCLTAGDDFSIDEYMETIKPTIRQKIEGLGIRNREPRVSSLTFLGVNSHLEKANPLQDIGAKISDKLVAPSLVIVEDAMGGGKTELAMYIASVLKERGNDAGIAYSLPTQATSDAMFERLQGTLANIHGGEGRYNCHLMHADAEMNATYKNLMVMASEWETGAVADWWMSENRKSLLADVSVGTIDQILMSNIQVKHNCIRLFGLADKVLILDEIHCYDTYMQNLIHHLLRWCRKIGCSVIILSATLPSERRESLIRAYLDDDQKELHSSAPYPRVTLVTPDGEIEERCPHMIERRSKVSVSHIANDNDLIISRLEHLIEDDGCIGVIMNTVNRCKRLCEAIRKSHLGEKVELVFLHSLFRKGDRKEKEKMITRSLSKQAYADGKRPKAMMVIGTQIFEQSIDLDFDHLISDIAPIDLLLQRIGRMHRFLMMRPKNIASPSVTIIFPSEDIEELPNYWDIFFGVYKDMPLLRTHAQLCEIIKDGSPISLPDDIEPLVERCYGESFDVPSFLGNDWGETLRQSIHGWENEKFRDNMESDICSFPFESDPTKLIIASRSGGDAPANTRQFEPTVNITVIFEIVGKLFSDPEGTIPIDPFDISRRSITGRKNREVLNECSVRASQRSTIGRFVKDILSDDLTNIVSKGGIPFLPDEWAKDAVLKKSRLVTMRRVGETLFECEMMKDGSKWKWVPTLDTEIGFDVKRS